LPNIQNHLSGGTNVTAGRLLPWERREWRKGSCQGRKANGGIDKWIGLAPLVKGKQFYYEGDEGNGIYYDHQEIGEKEEEEAARGFAGAHGALHPPVEEEYGYQ
jgi:hypothetical protein